MLRCMLLKDSSGSGFMGLAGVTAMSARVIDPSNLVRAALRMRPDRLVVGEVRSGEALDMLQALNTGHDGSMSTIHANGPADEIGRAHV